MLVVSSQQITIRIQRIYQKRVKKLKKIRMQKQRKEVKQRKLKNNHLRKSHQRHHSLLKQRKKLEKALSKRKSL
jgi:hypothetical protein